MNKIDRQILSVFSPHSWMYGLEIIDAIKERYKRRVGFSGLYSALDRLEREGLIEGCMQGENGTPMDGIESRGGLRRRYYRLTKSGRKVFNDLARDTTKEGSTVFGRWLPV